MGGVSRITGPIIIILRGKTRRSILNDDYLLWKVLNPGSTIIMTENTLMTHDAWYEATKNIICGYNQMPVIRDNPQW